MNQSFASSMTDAQISVVRAYKHGVPDARNGLTIPIINPQGIPVGYLDPIRHSSVEDSSLIEALTRWRDQHKAFFVSQFVPTIARTKSWLQNVILKDDSRLLFVICGISGVRIGNSGIWNLSSDHAELDNVLRGERQAEQGLMRYAEISLIHWIYEVLHVEHINLHVFEDSVGAIRLYRFIGFNPVSFVRLFCAGDGEDIVYRTNIPDEGGTAGRNYMEMALEKETFYMKHPWVRSHKLPKPPAATR